jgi:hypothetical protein
MIDLDALVQVLTVLRLALALRDRLPQARPTSAARARTTSASPSDAISSPCCPRARRRPTACGLFVVGKQVQLVWSLTQLPGTGPVRPVMARARDRSGTRPTAPAAR